LQHALCLLLTLSKLIVLLVPIGPEFRVRTVHQEVIKTPHNKQAVKIVPPIQCLVLVPVLVPIVRQVRALMATQDIQLVHHVHKDKHLLQVRLVLIVQLEHIVLVDLHARVVPPIHTLVLVLVHVPIVRQVRTLLPRQDRLHALIVWLEKLLYLDKLVLIAQLESTPLLMVKRVARCVPLESIKQTLVQQAVQTALTVRPMLTLVLQLQRLVLLALIIHTHTVQRKHAPHVHKLQGV
jgi:hypothetical protein